MHHVEQRRADTMHHLLAFSTDHNTDKRPKQTPMSQRLPLPHQTLDRLRSRQKQPASRMGLPSMLQDFLASMQGHSIAQALKASETCQPSGNHTTRRRMCASARRAFTG